MIQSYVVKLDMETRTDNLRTLLQEQRDIEDLGLSQSMRGRRGRFPLVPGEVMYFGRHARSAGAFVDYMVRRKKWPHLECNLIILYVNSATRTLMNHMKAFCL